MSQELERIKFEFSGLEKRLERYEASLRRGQFDPHDCRDIYGAIYSLCERFNSKSEQLTKGERTALAKVFRDDVFISDCVMPLRTICVHIVKSAGVNAEEETFDFRTPSRDSVTVFANTSAGDILDHDGIELDALRNGELERIRIVHSEVFRQTINLMEKAIARAEGA